MTCGPDNRVADLPYRAPEIDDAVFEVMTGEMQKGLRLYVAVNALYFLARPGAETYCPPHAEEAFQRLFAEVPFLWEGLIGKVAARLGCEDCGATPKSPVVSLAEAGEVLDLMSQGIHTPGGGFWLGLPVLRSIPRCDPNLAVAIARVQRGMGDVPPLQKVEEELRRMGASVVP